VTEMPTGKNFSVVTHMWWSYVRRVWGANFNGWEGLALPSPPCPRPC